MWIWDFEAAVFHSSINCSVSLPCCWKAGCVWWVQRKVSVMEYDLYDLVCMHEPRHEQSVILERKFVPWWCLCVKLIITVKVFLTYRWAGNYLKDYIQITKMYSSPLNLILQVWITGQENNQCSLGHLCIVLGPLSVMTSTDRGHTHILSPHMFTPSLYPTVPCQQDGSVYCRLPRTLCCSRIFSPVCYFTWVCKMTCSVCVCSHVQLKHIVCRVYGGDVMCVYVE